MPTASTRAAASSIRRRKASTTKTGKGKAKPATKPTPAPGEEISSEGSFPCEASDLAAQADAEEIIVAEAREIAAQRLPGGTP
jgi:hypothetical protein